MDNSISQYGFNSTSDLEKAMKDTGLTKFGKGSVRNVSIFGEDGLQAGATKEDFIDRITEIGFDSNIANACWEILNYNTDDDSKDVIDEDELEQLLLMYGSDFNGEKGDEINKITVGSLYTFINAPRETEGEIDSSSDDLDITGAENKENEETPKAEDEDNTTPSTSDSGDSNSDAANIELTNLMSEFTDELNTLLESGDYSSDDIINFAKNYDFNKLLENETSSADEVKYRSEFIDSATKLYESYINSNNPNMEQLKELNDDVKLTDLIINSFNDQDLRNQKFDNFFDTLNSMEVESKSSGVDWSKYDTQEALDLLSEGNYTNADMKELIEDKGGIENIIDEVTKYNDDIQKQYLDAIFKTMTNGEITTDKTNESEAMDPTPNETGEAENTNPTASETLNENIISDKEALTIASELVSEGKINKENINNLLNNNEYSQADIVKILETFNENNGSFFNAIDSNYLLDDRTNHINQFADILISQAENGNDNAINLLTKELKSSTGIRLGGSDDYITRLFNTSSDELIAQIVKAYPEINNNADIKKDIEKIFSSEIKNSCLEKIANIEKLQEKKSDIMAI